MTTITQTIALSSLFMGSVYMTSVSLKEINKMVIDNRTDPFMMTVNLTFFISSGLYMLLSYDKFYSMIIENKK